MMNNIESRTRRIKDGMPGDGPVICWISRDQRAKGNWALIHAQNIALGKGVSLAAVFTLVPEFLSAGLRQYDFMLKGLMELERDLKALNIPFHLLQGHPPATLPRFLKDMDASHLVTDFDPLRIKKTWQDQVAKAVSISMDMVDAHNIVPVWEASDKQEFAARTIRPKILKKLDRFLTDYPEMKKQPAAAATEPVDWDKVFAGLKVDTSVEPVKDILPGPAQAEKVLEEFIASRLPDYAQKRNDPNSGAVSGLSPYLHFGHIPAQEVAQKIMALAPFPDGDAQAFLEELIIRKELSDNFCHYNPDYDRISGAHAWAQKTLEEHWHDRRVHVYSKNEFEFGRTHSRLWNAAQSQMAKTGKMHGYMRMYWAKKILEWSETPDQALATAMYLNDKYSLDGRGPNGYTGVMWSIAGVHDRAWTERKIFGKIRYMNENGCRRKFNADQYADTWTDHDRHN